MLKLDTNKWKVRNLEELNNEIFDSRYVVDIYGVVYLVVKVESKYLHVKIMRPYINRDSYVEYVLTTKLGKKHFLGHRLVALAFIPKEENKNYVNHKDGNRQNNNISNLEWVTQSENITHSWRILRNK